MPHPTVTQNNLSSSTLNTKGSSKQFLEHFDSNQVRFSNSLQVKLFNCHSMNHWWYCCTVWTK